jgi:hypothetical protein
LNKLAKRVLVTSFVLAGVLGAWQVVSLGAPLLGQPKAPAPASMPAPVEMTAEQKLGLQAKLEAEGAVRYLSGPNTKGQQVEMAGRMVQLPADAYVKRFIVSVDCDPANYCPTELPFMIIERGQSTMWVAVASGKVLQEKLAPGEARAFDFLQGVVSR